MDRVLHKQFIKCKYCNSSNIVKYGTFQGMQRYFCKDCRRKFADNDSLPKMKTPVWIISLALSCYFEGMSLAAIQSEINQRHGAYYAQSSIYNWIIRFSAEAVRQTRDFQPKTGAEWIFLKSTVAAGNHRLCFLDIFDVNSRYLLASRLAETGTIQDAADILDSIHLSIRRRGFGPVVIFLAGLEVTGGPVVNTEKQNKPGKFIFRQADENDRKQFTAVLKKRGEVVHSFKSIEKARVLTTAWKVHYNFLTESNQPGHKAGTPAVQSWENIINRSLIIGK